MGIGSSTASSDTNTPNFSSVANASLSPQKPHRLTQQNHQKSNYSLNSNERGTESSHESSSKSLGKRRNDPSLSRSVVEVSFENQQPLVSIPLRPLITLSHPYPCVFRWVRIVDAQRRHGAKNIASQQQPSISQPVEYVISHSATYTPTIDDEGFELRFQCVVIKDARGEGVQVIFKKVKSLPHAVPRRTWREYVHTTTPEAFNGAQEMAGESPNPAYTTTTPHHNSEPWRRKTHSIYQPRDTSFQWRNNAIDKTFVVAVYNMMGNYWRLQESDLDVALATHTPANASTLSKSLERKKNRALKHELFHQDQMLKSLRRRFSKCPAHVFSQAYRKKMMLRELLSYHSDLYCLQNVNLEEYKYWNVELSKLGYSAFIQNHVGEENHHVGICLMYRRSKFNKSDQYEVKFSEIKRLKAYDEAWKDIIPPIKEYCEARGISLQQLDFGGRSAIIQEFDLRDLYLMRTNLQNDTDEKLLVANVELYVPPNKPKDFQEMMQLIQLFTVLKSLHYIWRHKFNQRSNIGFVLACDLGTSCESMAYKYVTQNLGMTQTTPTTEGSPLPHQDVSPNSVDDDTASSHEYTPAVEVSGPLSDSDEEQEHGERDANHLAVNAGEDYDESVPHLSIGDSCGSPDNYKVNVSPHNMGLHDYGSLENGANFMDIDIAASSEQIKPQKQNLSVRKKSNSSPNRSPKAGAPSSISTRIRPPPSSSIAPGLESPFVEGFLSAYQTVLSAEPFFPQSDANTTHLPTTTFIFFNNLAVRRVSSLPADVTFPNQSTTSNRCCELADLEFVDATESKEGEPMQGQS